MVSLRVLDMMYILLIGVIINATVTVINSMPCDENWLENEEKCLKRFNAEVPWTGANDSCFVVHKALLATVDRPEINMFVQNNLTRGSDIWIGLNIPDLSQSNWKWADGGNTSYYNVWSNEHINSACAVMRYNDQTSGNWYTKPCSMDYNYICEKEMSDYNCSDWLKFDNHCYLIRTGTQLTNMAAAQSCWQHNAYLVSVNSEIEAGFIYSQMSENKVYWIGLSPLKWVNAVPYQWNNWGENGPDITDRCVYIKSSNGKWYSGHCENTALEYPYICQRDIDFTATMLYSQTSNLPDIMETSTNTVLGESYTDEFDTLNMSNTQSSTDNFKQLLLTVVIPAVCGGLVAIILIIVVVILIRRKKRSNESNKRNSPRMNKTHVTDDIAVGGDNKDKDEHPDQEYCIYDEAEVVQADNGTVVVNGDVYAIVDKDKIQNHKVQEQMVAQQHADVSPKTDRKQEIAQDQNHIIVGSDVYAIVDKNTVKHNKQQKPKQKKKKPQTPPKFDDKSAEIKSNAPGHIVVGTDVYAVVDKEKVKPNKQQTSQQKKKKTPAPPNLKNKTVAINEGNVYYNEFDMKTVPVTPTKRKPKVEKKTEDTGVVYADLDLTGSGSGDRQNGNNDEESGVVYADVRG